MTVWIFMILLTLVTLSAAVYAHLKVGPRSERKGVRARIMLLVTGVAFGGVMTWYYSDTTGLMQLLVFASAFGVVHVPAACILLLKTLRRRQNIEPPPPR